MIKLPVPVISVGNVTLGGTGKTPLVIDLANRLETRGLKVAVVSRGYGARRGEHGDEMAMLADRLPNVLCVADPDRVGGGRKAVAAGAEVIVLDDGFQHRRVARDLDIVVVDATHPFGFERVIPRGALREPLHGLMRADLIVLSRVDRVDSPTLESLHSRLEYWGPGVERVECRHKALGLYTVSGAHGDKTYHRAICMAAIGNPEAFVATVRSLGIDPVKCLWWPDHHYYAQRDVDAVARVASTVDHDVILTTQKDAVKLRRLRLDTLDPVRVVAIDVEFDTNAVDLIESRLDSVLAGAPKTAMGVAT